MMFEPCKWYKNIKPGSHLENFVEERSIGIPSIYCDNDSQTFVVDYIQCVKLEEIEKIEPWSPYRIESVKKWATPDKLRRLKYSQEEGTGKRVIPSDEFHSLPMLSREYKLNNTKQGKFKISDGIHRINRGRELGIDCILSSISEHITIDRKDKDNIETMNMQ